MSLFVAKINQPRNMMSSISIQRGVQVFVWVCEWVLLLADMHVFNVFVNKRQITTKTLDERSNMLTYILIKFYSLRICRNNLAILEKHCKHFCVLYNVVILDTQQERSDWQIDSLRSCRRRAAANEKQRVLYLHTWHCLIDCQASNGRLVTCLCYT